MATYQLPGTKPMIDQGAPVAQTDTEVYRPEQLPPHRYGFRPAPVLTIRSIRGSPNVDFSPWESRGALSQPTMHFDPRFTTMNGLRSLMVVPFTETLAPTIAGSLDWLQPTVDVVWT